MADLPDDVQGDPRRRRQRPPVADETVTAAGLYAAHGDRLRRYLARLVGPTDAADLTQDVFERAHRAIGSFRGDSRVQTWLYRVATNLAIDRLRSAARRAAREREVDEGAPLAPEAPAGDARRRPVDAEVDRAHMRECILRVVEQLPMSQRAAILLGELRGYSDRELGDALGLSLGAAKIRLHRARRALKAALERACDLGRDDQNELACAPKAGGLVSLGRSR